MNSSLRPQSLGLVFGLFFALWHFCWAVMVWLGVAQLLLDFVFKLHMITPPFKVADFNIGTALALVVVTGVVGYVFGVVIGVLWKWCK